MWIKSSASKLFDKLLKIAPGGVYGLLSVLIGVTGDIIAASMFIGYNIVDNTISDLGVGPGAIFFNFGVFFCGFVGMPFGVALGKVFRNDGFNRKLVLIAVVTSLISCFSLSMIGVFPSNRKVSLVLYIHGFFALLCFAGGFVYLTIFSYFILKDQNFSKWLGYYGYFVAVTFMVFLLMWQPLTEWIANFCLISFTIICSIYMIYKKI